MTIPDHYTQISIEFTGGNVPHGAACVFGTVRNIELTAAQHATVAHDAFADAFCPAMSDFVTVASALCKFGPDETGASGVSTGIPRQGTLTNAPTSPGVSFLLTKNTALGGRRGKGRMFLPGVTETRVDQSGVIVPSVVTELTGFSTAFLAAMVTLGLDVVLLHGPATEWVLVGGQPRRQPVAGSIPDPSPVLSMPCAPVVATQRRRLR